MTTQITELHSTWCACTGQEINLRATERIWYELWRCDFSVDDLRLVVEYMKRFNRTHPDCQMKIQVHKVCGDLEAFASIVGECKARERNKVKPATPKEQVLNAWRPICGERVNGANVHRLSDFLKVPQ